MKTITGLSEPHEMNNAREQQPHRSDIHTHLEEAAFSAVADISGAQILVCERIGLQDC